MDSGLDAAKGTPCVTPSFYNATDTGILYVCQNNAWVATGAGSGGGGSAVCNVHGMVGSDLGAKINACAAQIGFTITLNGGFQSIWVGTPGIIRVDSPDVGPITTQAIIPSNQTLSLGNGTYTNSFGEYVPMIVVSDNSEVVGDGWGTILVNTSQLVGENPVIGMANAMVCSSPAPPPCGPGGCEVNCALPSTKGVIIKDIHFKDSGSGSATSLTGTIALTQCTGCKVIGNFFDGIATTAVTLVGHYSDNLSHPEWSFLFGKDDEIAGNLITGNANAGISVINNQNVSIHDNIFRAHGVGAAADIDLESNSNPDYMQYIDIYGNIFDCSTPQANTGCFGVTEQSVGPNVGHIRMHDNIFFGPLPGTALSGQTTSGFGSGNGFIHGTNNIEISNNQISNTSNPAITLQGVDFGWVHDNHMNCVGGAIAIGQDAQYSVFERNQVLAPQLTVFTVTSVDNTSGGNTVYHGTFTGGATNGLAQLYFTIAGFTNPLNNGTFGAFQTTATTLTLINPSGAAATQAATATTGCASTLGRAQNLTQIEETDTTDDYNIFRDNIGVGQTVLYGTHDQLINTQAANQGTDGSGQTVQVPTGFAAAIPGGLGLGQLTAPVLNVLGPSEPHNPSCVLSSNTYFWIVTAVDVNGREVPSNEVTALAGGGQGCRNLGWTYVPGAASYNVYRSLGSGTEIFVANVKQGTAGYFDPGGQAGGGAAVPTINTTGMLAAPLRTPASSSAPCTTGQMVWDTGFLYVCTSTNTWKQAALSAF